MHFASPLNNGVYLSHSQYTLAVSLGASIILADIRNVDFVSLCWNAAYMGLTEINTAVFQHKEAKSTWCMSAKKMEAPKDTAECVLRMGKVNTIIQWRDDMNTAVIKMSVMHAYIYDSVKFLE